MSQTKWRGREKGKGERRWEGVKIEVEGQNQGLKWNRRNEFRGDLVGGGRTGNGKETRGRRRR